MAKKKSANRKVKAQRILAKGEFVSNDTWETGLNNNDLIVGPTGAGKTRYYVKPNLLQMNESVVVTDTKGTLVREIGPVLEAHGYDVIHVDFTDPAAGYGYNPMDYIQSGEDGLKEQDVMRIACAVCPDECLDEPFWDHATRMYLATLIGYVMDFLPAHQRTLQYVVELAARLGSGETDRLLDEVGVQAPESFAARKWRSFSKMRDADRTHACVVGMLAERMNPLAYNSLFSMYSKEKRVRIRDIGTRKTAMFLTVSDTDRSADALVGLFYTQVLQELCEFADDECGGALPVPVRLYLDDFATNYKIADFDKAISVIRSRNIAVSVVLQSITQLETLYSHPSAMTIVNGCDHLIYLGGQDIETARFMSLKANKTIDSVLNQPVDMIWLFERGSRGKTVERYDLASHELYAELPEASSGLRPFGDVFVEGEPVSEPNEERLI